MNVEIGTEAVEFPEKEYINGIFLAVHRGRGRQFCQSLATIADKKHGGMCEVI
jgi:hypothetical protein